MFSLSQKPSFLFMTITISLTILAGTSASRTYPGPNIPDSKSEGASEMPEAVHMAVLLDLHQGTVANSHNVVLNKRPIPPSGPSHNSNKAPNSSGDLLRPWMIVISYCFVLGLWHHSPKTNRGPTWCLRKAHFVQSFYKFFIYNLDFEQFESLIRNLYLDFVQFSPLSFLLVTKRNFIWKNKFNWSRHVTKKV